MRRRDFIVQGNLLGRFSMDTFLLSRRLWCGLGIQECQIRHLRYCIQASNCVSLLSLSHMIFTEALGLLSCSPHPIPAFFPFSILKLFLLESSRKWLKTQKANETWKFMKLGSWNSQDSGSPESQKVYKTFIQRCVKSAKQPGELSCLYSWCATACKLDRAVGFVSYLPMMLWVL